MYCVYVCMCVCSYWLQVRSVYMCVCVYVCMFLLAAGEQCMYSVYVCMCVMLTYI